MKSINFVAPQIDVWEATGKVGERLYVKTLSYDFVIVISEIKSIKLCNVGLVIYTDTIKYTFRNIAFCFVWEIMKAVSPNGLYGINELGLFDKEAK